MDSFSQWQAEQAVAEPESSLSEQDWARVDKSVRRAFKKPFWLQPVFAVLAAAAVLGGAWAAFSGPDCPAPRRVFIESKNSFRQVEMQAEKPAKAMDPRKSRVQAVKPTPAELKSGKQGLEIIVNRQHGENVKVEIQNQQGRPVRLLYNGYLDAGDWSLSWDGCNDNGRFVESGEYKVLIESPRGRQFKQIELFSAGK